MPASISEARKALHDVWRALDHWPVNFEVEVERRLAAADADENSLPARLGAWYRHIIGFRDDRYQAFRLVIGDVAERRFDGSYPGAVKLVGERNWVSAAEAARHLSITAERLVAAVRSGRIPGQIRERGLGHRHCMLETGTVSKIRDDRSRFITKKEATSTLGISRTLLGRLLALGIVIELEPSKRPPLTDGGINVCAVNELQRHIRSSAVPVSGDQVAFRSLSLRWTSDRKRLDAVLLAICAGKIGPSAPAPALGDCLFNAASIRELFKEVEGTRHWSAGETADALGVKPEVVTNWIKLGLLKASEGKVAGKTVYSVDPYHVVQFQKQYLPVSTMASAAGTSSKNIVKKIEHAGVRLFGIKSASEVKRGYVLSIRDLTRQSFRAKN